MNRLTTLLAALLAVQLLLSALLFWPREEQGEDEARTPLLRLVDGIDRVVMSDAESSLLMTLTDAGWRMPEYHGLPVDTAKLERALSDLPRLSRGWPVANSAAAGERFEVAEDSFQRRVEYFTGDIQQGALYVGTSPGFRKVHVRVGDEPAVYSVEYNSFDLPVTEAEWLDKTLLQLEGVTAITGLDYHLQLDGDTWRGDADIDPDADVASELADALAGLRVTSAADLATASILEEMGAPPTLTARAGDTSYEFRLFEIEDAYYINRSDIPVYFSLSAYDYDRLNDVNQEMLYPPLKEDAEPGEAEADSAG